MPGGDRGSRVAGCRLPVAGCRLQVAGCRLRVAGRGLQLTSVYSLIASVKFSPLNATFPWPLSTCASACFFSRRWCRSSASFSKPCINDACSCDISVPSAGISILFTCCAWLGVGAVADLLIFVPESKPVLPVYNVREVCAAHDVVGIHD